MANAHDSRVLRARIIATALLLMLGQSAVAQAPNASDSKSDAKPSTPPLTLESLGWLEGCWRGAVNQRDFREHWLPLRGGMIVGAGGLGQMLKYHLSLFQMQQAASVIIAMLFMVAAVDGISFMMRRVMTS